jgi:hypothetical protein
MDARNPDAVYTCRGSVSMLFNVITPVSRPQNLVTVASSLNDNLLVGFEVRWWCVFDSKVMTRTPTNLGWEDLGLVDGDLGAGGMRNVALERIERGWVYCLDDDTVLHSDFPVALREGIVAHPRAGGYVFSQALRDGRRRLAAAPENARVGHLDMGQFVLDRRMIGDIRLIPGLYESDFYYFEAVYERAPDRVIFIDRVASYYNFLRSQ